MASKQNVAPARLAWICWQMLWLSLLWHWPAILKAGTSKRNELHSFTLQQIWKSSTEVCLLRLFINEAFGQNRMPSSCSDQNAKH